jgi:hypothetical protein
VFRSAKDGKLDDAWGAEIEGDLPNRKKPE